MSLTLTLTSPPRRLHATLTSSTHARRGRHAREHATHYRVHLSKRRAGGPTCARCTGARRVRFEDRCAYAVYDVATGKVVEEGVAEVDFVGGKEVGFLWSADDTDDTVWEIEEEEEIGGERDRVVEELIREIEDEGEGAADGGGKDARE